MSQKYYLVIIGILVALVGFLLFASYSKNNSPQKSIENQISNENIYSSSDVLGNREDLISFSIASGSKVSGIIKVSGSISGGYFFEGNMPISILDASKKVLKTFPSQATAEWITAGPVPFSANLDFTGLPVGSAFIALTQDDPSGGASGHIPSQVLIPIVIENSNLVVSNNSETYTYKNHGFTIELPKGYVPQEIKGETGPTISIELPPKGWLVYVSDATWWEKYNLEGQADFIRNQKIGNTIFKVYKFTGHSDEFYWFRQGNVGYVFNGDVNKYMETFKFVGWN